MIRVGDAKIACKVCGKNDWCLQDEKGEYAICARVSKGAIRKIGNAGWLHKIENGKPLKVKAINRKKYPINWNLLNKFYKRKIYDYLVPCEFYPLYSENWYIYKSFDMGWDGKVLTFPMRNEKREIIGIHKRYSEGKKGCEKGSQLGLFIPNTLDLLTAGRIYVCEGLSDTAAVYDLGYKVIGKPSARAGNDLVCKFVKREVIKEVIIIADNDEVGKSGAVELAYQISPFCWNVEIIIADTKDIRQDIQTYGKEKVIERLNIIEPEGKGCPCGESWASLRVISSREQEELKNVNTKKQK